MKIAVYGATGMVGSQVVNESLTRGHEVTAISRKGSEVAGAKSLAADLADGKYRAWPAVADPASVP